MVDTMRKMFVAVLVVMAFAMTFAMTFTSPAVASENRFTDDDNSVHEADIEIIAAMGITKGCTKTMFCPEELTTRGQMAAFMRRAIVPSADPTRPDFFTDIADSIFRADINEMAARRIVSGIGAENKKFYPDWPLSRIEQIRWMYRAGWCGNKLAKVEVFDDVKLSDPVLANDVPLVYACWYTGILKGHDGNMFPFKPVKRGEMASFIVRAVAD